MADTPRISVLTASCRPDGLPMLADCLAKQTFRDFEWVVCVPPGTTCKSDLVDYLVERVPGVRFINDPPRRPGDFYRLSGAWNKLVAATTGPLLVFYCDWTWCEADALDIFWKGHLED